MSPPFSSYGPIASSIRAAYDPVTGLPGLIWLIHPDDATDLIVNGTTGDTEINSIVDRKGGKTFSASAASNRMPLDTTERAPHKVATAKTSNADWLRCADATLAQALMGAGDAFTFFSLHRYSSASAGSIQGVMSHNTSTFALNTSSGLNAVSMYHSAPTSVTLRIADSSGTNFLWSDGDSDYVNNFDAWQSHIVTYDGAGTAELWVDGVSLGTRTGTARSPTGMQAAHYGGGASGGNPFHHGVKGACTGVLSSSDIAALHNWIVANA